MKIMKKTMKFAAVAVVAAAMCVSCSSTRPIAATSNPVGNKCGEATSKTILGFGGNSNMGINAAAKNGGITKISHVDGSTYSFLGLYTKRTIRVYGE